MPNGSHLSLIKPLVPAANLKELQRTGTVGHFDLLHEDAISKTQTIGNTQVPVLQQINCKKKGGVEKNLYIKIYYLKKQTQERLKKKKRQDKYKKGKTKL